MQFFHFSQTKRKRNKKNRRIINKLLRKKINGKTEEITGKFVIWETSKSGESTFSHHSFPVFLFQTVYLIGGRFENWKVEMLVRVRGANMTNPKWKKKEKRKKKKKKRKERKKKKMGKRRARN